MSFMRYPTVLLAICAFSVLSMPVFAQPVVEPGSELWVDGPLDVKPGDQPLTTDADVDYRGRQVFVWDSDSAEATEHAIFLRVFDAGGSSLVGPVQVNTYDDSDQFSPRVAVSDDGSFLVVWDSREPPAPGEPLEPIIRSQAYDAEGQPVGAEQVLSTLPTGGGWVPSAAVAALPGGGYIAVWRSRTTPNAEELGTSIQGRLIAANGLPVGGQFQVDSAINDASENDPSVTALADGGFLVVWSSRPNIWGRRFEADGTPATDDFQIHTYDSGNNRDQTDVALNENGRVLVVWRDLEDNLTDGEIRGRLYSPELVAQGSDFRINSYMSDEQSRPSVSNYGDTGFFVVVWMSQGSIGSDAEPESIEGRVVSGSNAFATPQFLVNAYTPTAQTVPAAGGRDDWVAVAWRSASNEEVMRAVIMGQLWDICGIFCDGFE